MIPGHNLLMCYFLSARFRVDYFAQPEFEAEFSSVRFNPALFRMLVLVVSERLMTWKDKEMPRIMGVTYE